MSTAQIAGPDAVTFGEKGIGQRAGDTSPDLSIIAMVMLSAACWAGIIWIVSLI